MISTLPDLIAPLTETEFSEIMRTRTLTLRRSAGANRFAGLLTWETFRSVIEGDLYPPKKLHVALDTEKVPAMFYRQQKKIVPERLTHLVQKGASFVANDIESFVPALDVLCADIGARLEETVRFTAVMTAGRGGAFKRHYDRSDIAVFQLTGSKRWKIYGPAVAYPERGMTAPPAPQGAPFFDEVLREGDFLYVPGGHWHECENGAGHSLHLSLMIKPMTGHAALSAIMQRMVDEEIFRVPFARMATADERAAHEAALKARLIDVIKHASLLNDRMGAAQADSEDEEY